MIIQLIMVALIIIFPGIISRDAPPTSAAPTEIPLNAEIPLPEGDQQLPAPAYEQAVDPYADINKK